MRIGIDTLVATPLRLGSIYEYTQRLFETIARVDLQHEWFLFVSEANRPMFDAIRNPHFHFILCPASNERMILRILSEQIWLPYYAKRYHLDVLYLLGDVSPVIPTCPYVIKLNTFHHHRMPQSLGPLRTWYRRVMNDRSARTADLLIANSGSARDEVVELARVTPSKVVIIDEAVDDAFVPTAMSGDNRDWLADKYGLDSPYLLFVSLLYRHKNMWRLIEAFARVVQRTGCKHDLVFAGRDPENFQPELESLATNLGVRERVCFLGRVEFADLVRLYQSADLFVYPSLSETFGKPPLEAMACGTPVVASNMGSIPEVVGDAALLVNPNDVSDIADKIEQVITNPTMAQELVSRGHERVRYYSWERVANETISALTRIADR